MIDVRALRTDPDAVRAAMARRGDPALLDQLDEARRLDEQVREITAERDALRARVNDLSKEVGQLRRVGAVEKAERVQAESRELGEPREGAGRAPRRRRRRAARPCSWRSPT